MVQYKGFFILVRITFPFEVLGCSLAYFNPESQLWGTVEDGQATGLFLDIVEERAHLAIGAILMYYERERVAMFSSLDRADGALKLAAPRASHKR